MLRKRYASIVPSRFTGFSPQSCGAAIQFTYYRLPEVFAGIDEEEYGIPLRYPVACHPQPGRQVRS